MSYGHSANNSMDSKPNQPTANQGAAVDVSSGPLLATVVKLTLKGTTIELTQEEAKQLKDALADLLGDSKRESQFEKLKREIERIRTDREPPTIIPQPYPVPVYPRPWRDGWPHYHEIWCSTDNQFRLGVEARVSG